MSLNRLCIICITFFCLYSTSAMAAENITTTMQAKYTALKTMQAEFSQILLHKESGSKESRTGSLQYKKPLLVRWETKTPTPELLVINKTEIWNVFNDEEIAYKYPLSMVEDSGNFIRVITGQARLEQDFSLENKGKEEGLIKLHLYPHEPSQTLVEAILWIEETSGLIKKFRIYDFYGNENEVVFTGQKIDKTLEDSLFAYTPDKDILVEDRTNISGANHEPLLQ